MKLITVEATFEPTDIATAIVAFDEFSGAVRDMDGCVNYAIYTAPNKILICQKWASAESFDTYRTSPEFAALGGRLKPIFAAPPVTTIADVVD